MGRRPLLTPGLLALALVASLGAGPAARVVVVAETAEIHQSPSPAAPVVGHAARGDVLSSYGRRGDWVNVALEGGSGWVREDRVAPRSEGDSTPSSSDVGRTSPSD